MMSRPEKESYPLQTDAIIPVDKISSLRYYGRKEGRRYKMSWSIRTQSLLGGFLRGQYDGDGVLTLPNGDIFKGLFSQGFKHGKGCPEIILHAFTVLLCCAY